MEEREYTAYHESGHVVARWFLGRGFRYVTIVPTAEYEGKVEHYPFGRRFCEELQYSPSLKVKKRAEDEVLIRLAGMAAIASLFPDLDNHGGEDDFHNACDFAEQLVGSDEELQAYMDWQWIKAKNLFAAPFRRRMLEAVKATLLERGRLTYQDVKDVIRAESDKGLESHLPAKAIEL